MPDLLDREVLDPELEQDDELDAAFDLILSFFLFFLDAATAVIVPSLSLCLSHLIPSLLIVPCGGRLTTMSPCLFRLHRPELDAPTM